ncbi:MAG TPA: hypothetical protein VMU54_17350 [Planctomycetota bacterium]|nr:hypothetical protein [Planctomycetota bacterium]
MKVTGGPPFHAVRVFPSLTFNKPVDLVPFPGAARWVLVEKGAFPPARSTDARSP